MLTCLAILMPHEVVASSSSDILEQLSCEPTGTYILRDSADCGTLMHCHEGRADVMVCSPDTHYSVELGTCVFANMSDCTPAPDGSSAFESFVLDAPVDFVVEGDVAADLVVLPLRHLREGVGCAGVAGTDSSSENAHHQELATRHHRAVHGWSRLGLPPCITG